MNLDLPGKLLDFAGVLSDSESNFPIFLARIVKITFDFSNPDEKINGVTRTYN